jgi:cyclopropane-fatty-acyl-phospholipid synthase
MASVVHYQHVGSKYYDQYFKLVDWALKLEGATAVVSSSTFPESRYTGYQYVKSLSACFSS